MTEELARACPSHAAILISVLVFGCSRPQNVNNSASTAPTLPVLSRYSKVDRVVLDVDKPVMMSCELRPDEIEAIQELFSDGWQDTNAQKWTVFGTIDVYKGGKEDEWSLMYTGEGDVAVTQFRGEHKYFRGLSGRRLAHCSTNSVRRRFVDCRSDNDFFT
jgi:hypothetical protein